MHPTRTPTTILTITVCTALAGCPTLDVRSETGQTCEEDRDCESELCREVPPGTPDICTEDCSDGALCPGDLVCARLHTGDRFCTDTCTSFVQRNAVEDPDYACVDGVPLPCSEVPVDPYCEECGCPDLEWCSTSPVNECQPQRGFGEECDMDVQCLSGNCGVPASGGDSQCLTTLGGNCVDTDCSLCITSGTFCTRLCETHDDCPDYMKCVENDGTDMCMLDCTEGDCDAFCLPDEDVCPPGQECVNQGSPAEYYTCIEY